MLVGVQSLETFVVREGYDVRGGDVRAEAVEDVGWEVGGQDGVGVVAVQAGHTVGALHGQLAGAGEALGVGPVTPAGSQQVSHAWLWGQSPRVVTET